MAVILRNEKGLLTKNQYYGTSNAKEMGERMLKYIMSYEKENHINIINILCCNYINSKCAKCYKNYTG